MNLVGRVCATCAAGWPRVAKNVARAGWCTVAASGLVFGWAHARTVFAGTSTPEPRATSSANSRSTVRVGAHELRASDTPRDFIRSYVREPFELVAGSDVLFRGSRFSVGARVDAGELEAVIENARRGNAKDVGVPLTADFSAIVSTLRTIAARWNRFAVSARYDTRAHQIAPHVEGRVLDVYASTAAIVEALRAGAPRAQLVVIRTSPDRTLAQIGTASFASTLSAFETHYAADEKAKNRVHNLKNAARRLDGIILLPGEELDFNKRVGERNEANGFRPATVIADGELTDGIGGGTCQIAGTLHAAAFFAGLEIIEHNPHTRPSSYIKMGLDAAVAYPRVNLRIRNSLPFPVAISVRAENAIARAEILGRESIRSVTFMRRIDRIDPFQARTENDAAIPSGARVVTQRGIPGFRITRVRVVRDVTTNISRRELWEDAYPSTAEITRVGTGPAGVAPADDSHPEYTADEYYSVLVDPRSPALTSSDPRAVLAVPVETRRPGKTSTTGWTSAYRRVTP